METVRKAWVTFRHSSAKLHLPCGNKMFQSCVDCFNSISITSSNTAPWVIGNRLSRHTECTALNASHWMHHIECITLCALHSEHHTESITPCRLNTSHWIHHTECITLNASLPGCTSFQVFLKPVKGAGNGNGSDVCCLLFVTGKCMPLNGGPWNASRRRIIFGFLWAFLSLFLGFRF